MGCRAREEILHICSCENYLERCMQLWGLHLNRTEDLLEQSQQRSRKMIRGVKYLSYQDRLRELKK